ncbi:MAG: alpha-ketoglutarate-dependent dioxygenase AlkB [Candidatus Lustribacter sp.]
MSLVTERGEVTYYPGFLGFEEGDALIADLLESTRFTADSRMMYGKRVAVPRETAGRGEGMAQPWTPRLVAARERLEDLLGTGFDYVFVNRYRDGRDSVAWHGDHEITGKVVASLSLGATREFDLRPKRESDLRPRTIALDVAHGDLVVMRGETQRYWEHRVRKDPSVHEQRINLTFRQHRVR